MDLSDPTRCRQSPHDGGAVTRARASLGGCGRYTEWLPAGLPPGSDLRVQVWVGLAQAAETGGKPGDFGLWKRMKYPPRGSPNLELCYRHPRRIEPANWITAEAPSARIL